MNRTDPTFRALLAATATVALGACALHPHPAAETAMTPKTPKEQIAALLRSIETGDHAPIASINPGKYVQHNLAVGDGLAGFGAVMAQLPKGSARAAPTRVFQDGDFVFAHTDYDFFGPKIGFDVFRFEDGRVVEHWDNLQEKPAAKNPSGRSMIDGPTQPTDLDRTQANKTLVRAFLEEVLVKGRMENLPSYFAGDRYLQHNPAVADGLSGLSAALERMAKSGMAMRLTQVHRVLGEGSFVLAMSEGTLGGKPTAFYDLFRVEGGKIAEHWDTAEAIPAKEQWKNANGKF
jgi:predicted SnoaL-like aldol condensation-catalyzing enzyme